MQMADDKHDLEVLENSQMVRLVYSFYFTTVIYIVSKHNECDKMAPHFCSVYQRITNVMLTLFTLM